MSSDERLSDELLLDRMECAWSEQCGACLNVVNAELPKVLAELAAAQARAEAVESAAITVLECIDDPLFLHADALKRSPHVKELRAVLAAAPEARDE